MANPWGETGSGSGETMSIMDLHGIEPRGDSVFGETDGLQRTKSLVRTIEALGRVEHAFLEVLVAVSPNGA